MERKKLDEIRKTVSALVVERGLECIEVLWLAHERTLQIYLDDLERERTITVDDCAAVSRLLSENAELDDCVDGAYNLEVSSPGLERPLRLFRDFEAHCGKEIFVQLTSKVDERRKSKGLLEAIEPMDGGDARLTIKTETGPWSFLLNQVQKAHLVYNWNA